MDPSEELERTPDVVIPDCEDDCPDDSYMELLDRSYTRYAVER